MTHAFTTKYDGLSRQLINDASICLNGSEISVKAQWDTGATGTCISEAVVSALGLIPTGIRSIKTPSGSDIVNTYLVDIKLPNGTIVKDVEAFGSKIGDQGIGALIGMNIICLGDLLVSNYGGKTIFSFRAPAQKINDFVTQINLENLVGPKHGPGKRKRK